MISSQTKVHLVLQMFHISLGNRQHCVHHYLHCQVKELVIVIVVQVSLFDYVIYIPRVTYCQ